MANERALVLGGGGLAGIAWETGVLTGLAAHGVDATGADYLVGTSAGSTVAAQLGSGLPLADLFQRQVDPARQNEELAPIGVSVPEVMETWTKLVTEITDPDELARRVGELALNADTVSEPARRAVIAGRLRQHQWPDRKLAIVAVDARSGESRVFDKDSRIGDSGVGLVDAVAASCAVPGIWPPVTIGDTRYIDGGVRTFTNADLAAGYKRVLILAPLPDPALAEQVTQLEKAARVAVITPDGASIAAFGLDPLDPAVRTPSAHAGYAQGERVAESIKELWQQS
jgi:NTE family protein